MLTNFEGDDLFNVFVVLEVQAVVAFHLISYSLKVGDCSSGLVYFLFYKLLIINKYY